VVVTTASNDRQALKGMVTSSPIKRAAKEAEGLLVDRIKSNHGFANGGTAESGVKRNIPGLVVRPWP
jgi:hypothetical protein